MHYIFIITYFELSFFCDLNEKYAASTEIYQTVSLLNSFDTDENFSLSFFFFFLKKI